MIWTAACFNKRQGQEVVKAMAALSVGWLRWIVVAGAAAQVLSAQDQQQQDQENDPSRGVARLGMIQGDVSVKRGDNGEWLAAAPNAPLVVDDRVLTGVNSKAEVQLDYSNFIRMASDSEMRFSQLEYGRFQVQVARGTVMARVLRDSESEVEVSTPNVAVRPRKRGAYRITVHEDGSTEVTVRVGEVEVYTPRGAERLKAGRSMVVRGNSDDPEFQLTAAMPLDEFDDWSRNRDEILERSTSYRYVDPSISGAEDLDNNGRWVNDPPYGNVWVPTVAQDWAPYRYGRWTWVDWYGWSWVSYDPWGWAPYHYGRWYRGSHGWCWWPGAMRQRHWWSPGLVAWVGFGGGGFNVGVGWGRVGWIPLAPHEPFYRWYGRDYYRGYRGGYNNITVINNVNISNVYRNARFHNGVTAVDMGDFRSGRYRAANLTDNDFRNASLARGQVPLTPERSNFRMADRDAVVQARAGSEGSRFFSRRPAAAVDRVPFEQQRRGLDEGRRRAFGDTGAGTRSGIMAQDQQGGSNDRGAGWRRMGDTRASDPGATRSTENTGRDRGGWRRFGEPRNTDNTAAAPRSTPNEGFRGGDTRSSGRDRSGDSGNWRRFGDPGSNNNGGGASVDTSRGRGWRNENPQAPEVRGNTDSGNWRRFEGRTDSQPAAPQVDRGSGRTRGDNFRSFESQQPNRGSESVGTPIVRERPSFRSNDSGGGGREWSRPSRTMEAPQSAPQPRMESPRTENRGGGGNWGGFGGGRSSGGDSGGGGRMRMEGGGARSSGGGSHGGGGGGSHSGGGGGGRRR